MTLAAALQLLTLACCVALSLGTALHGNDNNQFVNLFTFFGPDDYFCNGVYVRTSEDQLLIELSEEIGTDQVSAKNVWLHDSGPRFIGFDGDTWVIGDRSLLVEFLRNRKSFKGFYESNDLYSGWEKFLVACADCEISTEILSFNLVSRSSTDELFADGLYVISDAHTVNDKFVYFNFETKRMIAYVVANSGEKEWFLVDLSHLEQILHNDLTNINVIASSQTQLWGWSGHFDVDLPAMDAITLTPTRYATREQRESAGTYVLSGYKLNGKYVWVNHAAGRFIGYGKRYFRVGGERVSEWNYYIGRESDMMRYVTTQPEDAGYLFVASHSLMHGWGRRNRVDDPNPANDGLRVTIGTPGPEGNGCTESCETAVTLSSRAGRVGAWASGTDCSGMFTALPSATINGRSVYHDSQSGRFLAWHTGGDGLPAAWACSSTAWNANLTTVLEEGGSHVGSFAWIERTFSDDLETGWTGYEGALFVPALVFETIPEANDFAQCAGKYEIAPYEFNNQRVYLRDDGQRFLAWSSQHNCWLLGSAALFEDVFREDPDAITGYHVSSTSQQPGSTHSLLRGWDSYTVTPSHRRRAPEATEESG